MRKLKLLIAAAALLLGASSANAYTTNDLVSAGWTEVTSLPTSNSELSKFYYVIWSTDADLMLAEESGTGKDGSDQEGQLTGVYRTPADPSADNKFLWLLEYNATNYYGIRNLANPALLIQTRENAMWRVQAAWERAQSIWTQWDFAYANGNWTIANKLPSDKGGAAGNYLGPWGDIADNMVTAGNKNSSQSIHFKIYKKERNSFDFSTATKSSPLNVTDLIANHDFSWGGGFWTREGSAGNQQWGNATMESWQNNNVSVTQKLTEVPNGVYKLTVDMISGNDTKTAYVYAKGDEEVNGDKVSAVTSAGNYGTMSNEVAGKTLTADNIFVSGNEITVGFKDPSGWIVADNFKLYYYGPTVIGEAIELPVNGNMNANQWYKYMVDSDGSFTISATNAASIVSTSNGQVLIEDATTSTITTGNDIQLTAGVIYFYSSVDNNLSIEPNIKTYSVGEVSAYSLADNVYLQTFPSTITFTLGNATTNDVTATLALQGTPTASLKKGNSEVKTGTLSLNADTKVVTATFEGVELDAGSQYTVTLPADAVAWDKNTTNKNEEKVITFNTPAVFDGHYYIKKDGANLFFSRGGDDNKQVVLDQFGVPVKITTDENNVSRVKFVDTGLLLGASGSSNMYWTDKGTGTPSTIDWTITKSGDKFKFYLNDMEDAKKGMNIHTNGTEPLSDTEANACTWELELPAAHPAKLQAVKDAQAAAIANAQAITGVSTQAEMAAKLAADYGETAIAITGTGGTNKEAWQGSASTGTGSELAVFAEETVSGLAPGLYRLRVYAFERIAGGQTVYDAGGAAGLAYVYANDQKVKLASLFDVQADTPWLEGNDLQFGGKYYANGQTGAQAAFDAGKYANDVYVIVVDEGEGTGSIKFGIKQPNCYYEGGNRHDNSQWICYNNFSLTYFNGTKATDAQKEALANAITAAESKTLGFEKDEYAPYNNVDALEALAAAKALNPATAPSTDVADATTALTGATWTANSAEVDAIYNGDFAIGQGSAAADIQKYGWTRTNGWGQFQNGAVGDNTNGTCYYNQPGSLQYGNAGIYTMPLKANTIYRLQFKYGSWDQEVTPEVSVLNATDGMAAMSFAATSTNYKTSMTSVDMVFVTGAAGNYVLTIAGNKNLVITGVSIKKAASQVLVFTDGQVPPVYAPGKYPAVKVTRSMVANRWYTAVYPFAVSGTIATLSSYVASTGTLGFTTSSSSEANKPFLMRNSSDVTEINLNNVQVAAAVPVAVIANEASLIGTYSTMNVTNTDTYKYYVLSNNFICPVSTDAENPTIATPYRAFIQIEQPSDDARALTFVVDGEQTSIEGVTAAPATNGEVYNLNGQRVNAPVKGLYIVNGKKVIMK